GEEQEGHNEGDACDMRGRHRLSSGRDAPAAKRRLIRLLRFAMAESVLRITASPVLLPIRRQVATPGTTDDTFRNAKPLRIGPSIATRRRVVRPRRHTHRFDRADPRFDAVRIREMSRAATLRR